MGTVPADILGPLLQILERSKARADRARIAAAFEFAAGAHGSQLRLTGEPYVTHWILTAALLHDVVEDTDVDLKHVGTRFGPEVELLVDGVTKIGGLHFDRPEWEQAENFRKMLLSMAKDLRVILIKLADRLHNMRTLHSLDLARATRIARETREIYAPLAHRLGIARFKWELEDLCLKYLDPDAFNDLRQRVQLKREEREGLIEDVMRPLIGRLEELEIRAEVTGRPKHLDSIYRKMEAQNRKFEEIFDLLGVRVITPDKVDCYRVLGLVHDLYTPVHERFKDYIATPKSNMYQSLHTTVVVPGGTMVEFQIRTLEMHKAEVDLWQKLEPRAKKLEHALKSPRLRLPSQVYQTLIKAPGDELLFLLYRSTQRTVQDRIRNYLQKYYPTAQEVSDAEVEKAGGKPGTAKYARLREELITTRLNTRKKPAPPPPMEPAAPVAAAGSPGGAGRDRRAS